MSFTIVISSKAAKEFSDSINWYEEQSTELGDRFEEAVVVALHNLLNNHNKGSLIDRGYRQAVVPVFPFIIVYKVHVSKQTIHVASIFHTSRSPSKKFRNQ